MEHSEKNEDERILEETVMGLILAVASTEKSSSVQCGLVFATKVMIVAFFKSKIANIAGALRTPDYHIMKNAWAKYLNKPTASILHEYRCYIIPTRIQMLHYSLLRGNALGSDGERKNTERCILSVFTPRQRFNFFVNTSKRTLELDVGLFLERVGLKFSRGE
jgi:hypothetical protein